MVISNELNNSCKLINLLSIKCNVIHTTFELQVLKLILELEIPRPYNEN